METDFGLAIIHAAVWAFNNMSFSQYLKLTFYLLKKHDKGPLYFMILHICSLHILKTVKRKKKLHMLKRHIFLSLKWVTKLIQSTDLDTAKNISCQGVTMFGIEYEHSDLNETVKDVLKETLPEDNELDCADDRTQDEFLFVVETQKYRHSSPHWACFNKATKNVSNKCREKGEFVEIQKLGEKCQ